MRRDVVVYMGVDQLFDRKPFEFFETAGAGGLCGDGVGQKQQ